MSSAEGGGPLPDPLQIRFLSKEWGVPPVQGGMLDQPYRLVTLGTSLENIYNTVTRLRNMRGKQIHRLTTQERRLIRGLLDEGML